jgi:hypothetical protein
MLLETIQRHDNDKKVKLVCIEAVFKTGRTLPQIHSVPALMLYPTKQLLFGKSVFDLLLLPGKGRLLVSGAGPKKQETQVSNHTLSDPSAFSMSRSSLSDTYSCIDDESQNETGDVHRKYNWTSISDTFTPPLDTTKFDMNQESRTKKELPDISEFQARRSMELSQQDINLASLPPAISGR